MDTTAREGKIYADYHSHPAVSTFSPEDLKTNRQRFYFRMMFNTACEIYLYDFQARMVSRLQEGVFIPFEQVSDQVHGE